MTKSKEKSEKKKLHFMKEIPYSKEPWRTDFIFGQEGTKSHGHMVASGALIYYLRDEQNNVIIENGIIKNNSREINTKKSTKSSK